METNWSISLEDGEYECNLELVVREALDAVQQTAKGFYVNVVTPANFGNPEDYLSEALLLFFGNKIDMKYIDQCGCGGYVLRVWKNK
ncbi:CGCGG family rSAM-modified RiPP protein [Bacillus sp. ISL-47]|uniref:CGCGG family putative rSAM-modified RiPP protein n=1 Tax=Bacillus sp. ISL-47 TaxID=2819130 RepID=UPI001BE5C5A1|nr:CGCGG family rSAM-modified RiPP protein [Bacillus sp. ISL-47]MBT2687202.1 CGCGG family rSAM-modified RiPP protein [Bacillus sp. ISL-47]MBT2709802.1 CGCGG family rSAM-modified RiPP protein [Pseudomonas sp. ISL-84]